MASRQTTAKLDRTKGDITLQHNETDSPLVNVEQLERLHAFRPDTVDWVMQQTQAESEHRRSEQSKVNWLVFIEHVIGQFFAVSIGLGGAALGAYVALNGQPWAGVSIATVSIGSLAIAFLGRGQKQN